MPAQYKVRRYNYINLPYEGVGFNLRLSLRAIMYSEPVLILQMMIDFVSIFSRRIKTINQIKVFVSA